MKTRTVDDLRLAFERIPYFLVLKAMIVRFFFNEIKEVPEVRFQRLPGGVLAQVLTRTERFTRSRKILPIGPSVIYLDTLKFAQHQSAHPGSASLLAILAHELVHVHLHQCARLKGIHSATFWAMADVVADFGCPVARDGYRVMPAYPATPCDWRRSMAIEPRRSMAIEVRR